MIGTIGLKVNIWLYFWGEEGHNKKKKNLQCNIIILYWMCNFEYITNIWHTILYLNYFKDNVHQNSFITFFCSFTVALCIRRYSSMRKDDLQVKSDQSRLSIANGHLNIFYCTKSTCAYCYRKGRYDYTRLHECGFKWTYTMRDVTRTITSAEINPVQTIRTEEPRCNYIPAYINMRYVRFELCSGWWSGVFLSDIYGPFMSVGRCCAFIICPETNVLIICITHIYSCIHCTSVSL